MLSTAVARWLACLLDGNVKGAQARRARAVHRLAKARAMRRWASRWTAQRAATRFRTTRFAPCLAAHVTHRQQARGPDPNSNPNPNPNSNPNPNPVSYTHLTLPTKA